MHCGEGMCVEAPYRPTQRCSVYAEHLYLQMSDGDVTHAQQQNGIGGAGTVPFGEIGSLGQDFNQGFRVGASVACGVRSSVGVSFTHFETDSASRLDAPSIVGGGGAVGSLVHLPGAAITASSGPVNAAYDVSFQLADVMCRTAIIQGPCNNLGVSWGVEAARLEQDFSQSGIFGGGAGGAIDTETAITFDGIGVKFGIDGDHQISRCFGVYGRLSASALTGRFDADYSMLNSSTDQMLAFANWSDDRVIGRFEYEAGVSASTRNGRWRAATGYMFSYWTNTVTTPDFIDAVQADNYTDLGDTLGFNGLVGRVECRW